MHTLSCWNKEDKLDCSNNHGPITVMVPARFDFIGGWTDTPPYYFDNNGCVLNATLVLSGEKNDRIIDDTAGKWIKISIYPAEKFSVTENGVLLETIDDHLILSKTFEFLHITKPDISISISNMIPKGSGLGGSSLLVVSLLAALYGYYKGYRYISSNITELINNVLLIEQFMESGGGWQDQIGGFLPGIKLIETAPEKPCKYSLSYLDNSAELINRNSLIIDTRIQRKAARILCSIRQKYIDRDPQTVTMLKKIAVNARLGFTLLKNKDIESFAGLLSESWRIVNEVECSTVEPVSILEKLCGNDLTGMKIGGAGGGGFILAIFRNEEIKAFYKQKITELFQNCLIYEPVFGGTGLSVFQHEHNGQKEGTIFHMEKTEYL